MSMVALSLMVFSLAFPSITFAEEKRPRCERFELVESGQIIEFGDCDEFSNHRRNTMIPPISRGSFGFEAEDGKAASMRPCERFELAESGQIISFGDCKSPVPNQHLSTRTGVGWKSRPGMNGVVTSSKESCETFEMPESGHVIVFGNCSR